jgi:NADPH-ferrihemoprotein reductase
MRGFLQKRLTQLNEGKKLGNCLLFFGCRNKDNDYIYEEEQKNFLSKGVISKHFVAFSRDQKDKIYVQNLMEKNGQEIWEMLSKNGYIFVCGDAKYM